MKAKCYVVQFFLQKKGLISTHQSAIKEAPTVFSRLPSLMEADKLQPSLHQSQRRTQSKTIETGIIFLISGSCNFVK